MAPPPFGNFDPNSGLRSGVAFGGNGVNGTLGFTFGQGSSRTITSTTPSVTLMDGVPGGITSQTIRPFVTGITPVVGDYPTSSFGTIPSPGQQMGQAIQQAQQADLQRGCSKPTGLDRPRRSSTSIAVSVPRRKATRKWRGRTTGSPWPPPRDY